MDHIRTIVAGTMLAAGLASAQSADEYRHPIGLFADLAADTVTSDLFNHFGPLDGWRFEATDPAPGLDLFHSTENLICADFDQDGWTDVLLAGSFSPDDPPSRLLWGGPGGAFEVVEPSPVPGRIHRATRADVDGDGLTDLVVLVATGGVRNPRHDPYFEYVAPELELTLLINQGGRRFAATPLGIPATAPVLADLDRDGWLDLVTATDQVGLDIEARLRVLRGGPGGFVDTQAHPTRAAVPAADQPLPLVYPTTLAYLQFDPREAGDLLVIRTGLMDPFPAPLVVDDPLGNLILHQADLPTDDPSPCLALADVDGDGRPDLFRGSNDFDGGRNRLYLDVASGRWHDVGRHAGLWGGYTYTRGAAWGDADNDGLSDLWQCRAYSEGRNTEGQFYWNQGDTTLVNATAALSRPASPSSLCAAWLDADRDGRLDLLATFITHYTDVMPFARCRPILYLNRSEAGHWLTLELDGRPPNTDAIGAVIKAWAGGRVMWRHLDDGTTSGGAAPPLVQHLGLGTATQCDSVAVWWPPRGERQVWRALPAGQRHVLRQR